MKDLTAIRRRIRRSLTWVAHRSEVSRFRLWSSERGDVTLTPEEQARILRVLRSEAEELKSVFAALDVADTAA